MIFAPWLLVPTVLVGPAAEAPPPKAEDLEALLGRLRGSDGADRMAAAKTIAEEPASGLALYAERLRRPRPVAADVFRKLILEMWGQVPNPNYGKDGQLWAMKPEPKWKPAPVKKGQPRPRRPPPHDPEKLEWLGALNDLDLDGNEVLRLLPDRVEARALAMEAVALLRALSHAGRGGNSAAVEPLFDFAFDLDGVFRDECGRQIRAMQSYAIPGLVRRMRQTGRGIALYRMKRYASYQLDRMDRAQPAKAITTAPDDVVRAAIIHSYGEVRALDAVAAILAQVDASSRRVRGEARWGWLRYVTGPPPPEAPKRQRKLPGGKVESDEKEDYLNYREMAVLELAKVLAEIRGEAPRCAGGACRRGKAGAVHVPPNANAKKMTDELFAFYDKRRAAEWDAQFNAAQAKAKAGDLAGAIADYSLILAHDPLYGRRTEIAGTFFDHGEALLAAGDDDKALALLRQAVALDPQSARAPRARARIAYLEGMKRLDAGQAHPEEFSRALAFDPDYADARRMVARLDARKGRKGLVQATRLGAVGLASVLALLALARHLAVRRRNKADASPVA